MIRFNEATLNTKAARSDLLLTRLVLQSNVTTNRRRTCLTRIRPAARRPVLCRRHTDQPILRPRRDTQPQAVHVRLRAGHGRAHAPSGGRLRRQPPRAHASRHRLGPGARVDRGSSRRGERGAGLARLGTQPQHRARRASPRFGARLEETLRNHLLRRKIWSGFFLV